jgi:hypothetical protein
MAIMGSGFGASRGSSTVTFNGAPVTDYIYWSDKKIIVVVPEGATSGPVIVRTAQGGSNRDRDFTLTYPRWYLAEGSTDHGFSTRISIENPNDRDLNAVITYMLSDGTAKTEEAGLPAMSQVTVNPADTVGAADFSTNVWCIQNQTIAVDRTMSWTGPGAASPEGHSSIGVTSPVKTWYLAEGCSAYGFETWLLIQNPGETTANVTITYMTEGWGSKSVTLTYLTPDGPLQQPAFTMPGDSRKTVRVNDALRNTDFSTRIVSNEPIVAERAMYWDNGIGEACHASTGLPNPHTTFYMPDGETSGGNETYTLVANPNNVEVEVEVTYLTAGATTTSTSRRASPRVRAPRST